MDITSILGVVIGAVLIVFVGIGPAKLGNFWDPASIAIVVGGTIAAGIASYPFNMLLTLPKHTKMLFQGKKYNIGWRWRRRRTSLTICSSSRASC